MEKNINFIVEESENNLRVDILINKREVLISRTRIKNLILKEKLKLNNEIIKSPSKKVLAGICLFYFSFSEARKKGSLINMGE